MNLSVLRNKYQTGERFDYVFFFRSNAYFSNWYPSNFVVDGVKYWCTEQYMMAKKAELFGDTDIQRQIMTCDSQRDIKALGRKIRGFNDSVWFKHREKIVFDGNYAKFTQNPVLLSYIKNQAGKILVEASPYDKIWGIGIEYLSDGSNRQYIENPFNWRGTNLLGFVLMDVRDKIISEGW